MAELGSSSNGKSCPPMLALERAHRGELKGSSSERWIAHIESCLACKEKILRLKEQTARFENDSRRGEMLEKLQELQNTKLPRRSPRRSFVKVAVAAGVAALAASLAVVLFPWNPIEPESPFIPKGSSSLVGTVFRQDLSFEYDGSTLAEGDVLELTFLPSGDGYLTVWAVERGEKPVLIFPKDSTQAAFIEAGGAVPVGDGLEITHTTRDISFFAVFGIEGYLAGTVADALAFDPAAWDKHSPYSVFGLGVRVDGTNKE